MRDRVADRLMLATVAQRVLGSQPAAAPKIGRFVVLGELGGGGMGQVFRVYDPKLDRQIALKVLRAAPSGRNEHTAARLESEALALARLNHPNVVTIYEVGLAGHELFLAMELVEGQDLRGWASQNPASHPLREDDRMRMAEALLQQAGLGLAAAHAADLVHRDFKPSNVLVGSDHRVRVADFGLARGASANRPTDSTRTGADAQDLTRSSTSLTATGGVVGTPRYMAPEQRGSGTADTRADQFAFCTTAWEILFGEHPWWGRPPGEARPSLPRGAPTRLTAPLLRGMDHDPDARYSSLTDLLEDLAPANPSSSAPWRYLAAAAALGVGIAAVVPLLETESDPCDEAGKELAKVWGESQQQNVRETVLTSGVPFAERTWMQVADAASAYANTWTAERQRVCRAVGSHGSTPATAASLSCLAQRRRSFAAFLDVLADGSLDAISTAAANAAMLPPVEFCGEDDYALHGFEPPSPENATAVENMRKQLARAEALRRSGQYAEADATLSSLGDDISELDVERLSDDYAFEQAKVAGNLEDFSREEDRLLAVYASAVHHSRTSLAVDAAGRLATSFAARGDLQAARRWLRVAETMRPEGPDQDLMDAMLSERRGDVLAAARTPDAAVVAYANAVEAWTRVFGPNSIELTEPLRQLGMAQRGASRFDEARQTLDDALGLAKERGAEHPAVAKVLHEQAMLAFQLEDFSRLRRLSVQVLAITESAYGEDHPATARTLVTVANAARYQGHATEARELLARADAIYAKAGDAHRASRIRGWIPLVALNVMDGRHDDAVAQAQRVLDEQRRLFGATHPSVADALYNLGYAKFRQGKAEESLALHREALSLLARNLGPDHLALASAHSGVGTSLVRLERFDEARIELTRALQITEAAHGKTHPSRAHPLYNLGACAQSEGDWAEAARFFAAARTALQADGRGDSAELAYPLVGLAKAHLELGEPSEALPVAEQALGLLVDGDRTWRAMAQSVLARAVWVEGSDRPRARELADAAMAEFTAIGDAVDGDREEFAAWRDEHGL